MSDIRKPQPALQGHALRSAQARRRVGSWRCSLAILAAAGGLFALAGEASPAGATSAFSTASHWGAFFDGVRGQDKHSTDQLLSPSDVALPGRIVQVASSNSTQYALLANGSVYAWGLGQHGELGDGQTADSLDVPVEVQFPAGVHIAFLPTDAMPFDTGLAVDTRGNAWGWGYSTNALCLPTGTPQRLVPVELPLHDVTALAGASGHAVYDAGGVVYACGQNEEGELGNGTSQASSSAARVDLPAGVQVASLVASFDDAGALSSGGTFFDWGSNAQGQLGSGSAEAYSTFPVEVPLPGPVSEAAQGGSDPTNGQNLVMLSDGQIFAWGADAFGQLGDGSTTNEALPIAVTPPAGVTYVSMTSGGTTSYAISSTGEVFAWGDGRGGELGYGGYTTRLAQEPVSGVTATMISATADDVVISASSSPAPPPAPG